MRSLRLSVLLLLAVCVIAVSSCKRSQGKEDTLPNSFVIDIPESLSNSALDAVTGNRSSDNLDGEELYELLRVFVRVGEDAAETINEIINGIRDNNIDRAMNTNFDGGDGRQKNLTVTENVDYNGTTWGLKAVISDVESGNVAMQVFWTPGTMEGIAILKPYELDRNDHVDHPDAMYMLEYTETTADYDKQMIVSITVDEPEEDWGIDALKLFVGKTGDIIEVRGNSNHPGVSLVNQNITTDRNWAFVGRCDEAKTISVAKVGIPASTETTNTHAMLEANSIANIIEGEFWAMYDTTAWSQLHIDSAQTIVNNYVAAAQQPAYFSDADGFINAGPANQPTDFSDDFVDLSALNPYIPANIKALAISFQ